MAFSKQVREQHLNSNRKWWEAHKETLVTEKNSYIEHQEKLEGMVFGVHNSMLSKLLLKGRRLTAVENSCEVIAVYNGLRALGLEADFPELLHCFESSGIWLRGYFGTTPWSLRRCFLERGLRVKILVGPQITEKKLQELGEQGVYLLMTMNQKWNIFAMIHTVCITREERGYFIHNDYEGSKSYSSLEAAVFGYHKGLGRPLYFMQVMPNE